ncbi:MAG: hypothetical protein HY013_06405 [Candidatus Solibacter usitatus]|nr:hypothetical protein [Candidatus Solibacter usitatus]
MTSNAGPAGRWSSRVAYFDAQTFPERRKRRFDLIQPGVVAEREQPFDARLGYSNAAGKLRFLRPDARKAV